MVLINYATKELVAKIVYYGPGLCGKTTNLQQVFAKLNPKKRGKMISLATEADRTLFFDFLPMELGMVQGFKVRFQLYTVPGQVFYGATRRLVLKGADAVVFVADSQTDVLTKNAESIEDMKQNLIENSLDPDAIPIVFQYNKRDLGNILDIDVLEKELNYRGVPYFAASAVDGTGVMETFREITRMLLHYLKAKHAFMDTDKLKDIPAEVFEYKPETPAEDKPIEYELELGSAVRDEGAAEEVVAGELLDQVETISLADAAQAETFFDVVRKGASAEEAKQKAEHAAVEPEPAYSFLERAVELREREFTPEELDLTGPKPEIADESMPAPKKAPTAPSEVRPSVVGLDVNPPNLPEPDFMKQPSETFKAVPVETPPPPPPAPPVDLSPIILALERLESRVAELGGELKVMQKAISAIASAPAPAAKPTAGPSVSPAVSGQLEELGRSMKEVMDGHDKLLLSILESVRESKKMNVDTSEKFEDALKYIIDKIRDAERDEGKGGKKKWF